MSYVKGVDGGGASTLTMQLSKNTFTSTETKGFDGIVRNLLIYICQFLKLKKTIQKKK